MFCKYCGHEQNEGGFCDECGKPMRRPAQPAGVNNAVPDPAAAKPSGNDKPMERPAQTVSVNNIAPEPAAAKPPKVGKPIVPLIAVAATVAAVVVTSVIFMLNSAGKKRPQADINSASPADTQAVTDTVPDEPQQSEASTEKVETTAETDVPEPVPVIEEKTADLGWIDAYIEAAEQYKRDYSPSAIEYRLMYINDDDIPEFYIRNSSTDHGLLYTYSNGSIIRVHETLSAHSQCLGDYLERSGEYLAYDTEPNINTGKLFFYTLDNDGKTMLVHTAVAEGGMYTIDGTVVGQSEYEKLFEGYTYVMSVESIRSLNTLKKTLHSYDPDYVEEPVEVVPATELAQMTLDEIKDMVGDDYRISSGEYFDSLGNMYMGITSDEYFPNVLIGIAYHNFHTAEEYVDAFENTNGTPVFPIFTVFEGGLIGDGAKVGDTYCDMVTKIDSLGCLSPYGAGTGYANGNSFIDGRIVLLFFDHLDEIQQISDRNGNELVDAYNIDPKCTMAIIDTESDKYDNLGIPATVTSDKVPLRIAPFSDSTVLLSVQKGEKVYIEETPYLVGDQAWYKVCAYYCKGVRKHGFIHTDYVKKD